MSITSSRLPLSLPNILLIGGSLAGAIATAALGNLVGTVLLLIVAVAGLTSALVARRPGASDLLRINAIEYRDERDTLLASHGFAVVGAWALVLAAAELIAAAIFAGITGISAAGASAQILAGAQLFILSIIWGIANTRAVRRG